MWERHNRRYKLLDETACDDLIHGFRSQGRQEFPAIVRKVDDDPDYDYEVICGARRHWTVTWLRANNYPEFFFLIEVRDLTDEQSFRLSDIENRDKKDISDYERALDYKGAMSLYYRTQKEMAARLQISPAWLSELLYLAEFPEEVVGAYADIRDIRTRHARELRSQMKTKQGKSILVRVAKEVASKQASRRNENRALLNGAEVMALLKAGLKPKRTKVRSQKIDPVLAKDGSVLISGTYNARSGWSLKIPPTAKTNVAELVKGLKGIVN